MQSLLLQVASNEINSIALEQCIGKPHDSVHHCTKEFSGMHNCMLLWINAFNRYFLLLV